MTSRKLTFRWFRYIILAVLILGSLPLLAQDASPAYRQFGGVSSRDLVWIIAQVKLMFAAFILGVPMFALIIEFVGWLKKDEEDKARWDKLAREFIKLSLIGFSATAALGAVLLFCLITLYPVFWDYMSGIFKPTMWIYPILFFGESFTLYIYWYGWDWLTGKRKWVHLGLGLLLNLFGTAIVVMTNAWATFMMTPGGIDDSGALVDLWGAIANATWNPLNIHRLIANAVFGGTIAGAYAGFKFLLAKSDKDRAYYDWMGYVGNMVAVSVFLVLPFAGYWLGKEIYDHNQQMGITLMGGFLSWLWIIQAILIGILFLSANFYLWVGMERIDGAERYRPYIKYMLFLLLVCVLVWSTPHSLVASLEEARAMGGSHHPLLGVLGVMSAKNTAVNIMILTTFLSFALYRRGNLDCVVPWKKAGLAAQWVILGIASLIVIGYGIYGYSSSVTPEQRIGFAPIQVMTVLLAIVLFMVIDVPLFKGAKTMGQIHWGKIPARAQYALFLLAVSFCWLMGLMGYARSALRQNWHVYGVLQDTSADAFLPPLGLVAYRISISVIIFILMISFIFWLGNLSSITGTRKAITLRGTKTFANMFGFTLVVIGGLIIFANKIPQVENRPPAEIKVGEEIWTMDKHEVAALGKEVFYGKKAACTLCHEVGKKGQRAPDLQPTAKLAETRVAGQSAATYLVESMINPGAYVVDGYSDQMPPMNRPPKSLTPAEIYMVICYLQELGGTEITVSKADIPDADKAPDELAAGAQEVAVVLPGDPEKGREYFFSYGACFACHVVEGQGQEVGPDLSAIAAVSALDYITESILDPNKVVVGGYPAIMPSGYGETLKAKDFNNLVSYLMTLKGGQ